MAQRGRKSAASLTSVPSGIVSIQRPDPPEDLGKAAAAEWRRIVARLPADWFPAETWPILADYCAHAVASRRLRLLADKLESARTLDLDQYERVLKLLGSESRLLASLGGAMRITQRASYDRERKKVQRAAAPPWAKQG